MKGLDITNCQKISQDKDSATFRHKDGHEIKIAIGALKPAMKKQLAELPLHQAEPEAPVEAIKEIEEPIVETPVAQEAAPAPVPQPQAAPQVEQQPAPQPAPVAPAAVDPSAPLPPADEAMHRTAANMAFADDLHQGRVEPKTYASLFHDKSLPGKLGTIFGMMLSGAGSGLSHQPNALLAMMDKQISNDLEAQKTDQSNRQNWYKMSLEHDRNAAANALTGEQVDAAHLMNNRSRWQNKQMGVPVEEASAKTDAYANSALAMTQMFQDNINKMPPGPARDAQQSTLNNVIRPAVANQIMNKQSEFSKKKAFISAAKTKMQTAKTEENGASKLRGPVIDQKKFEQGLQFARNISGTGITPKGAIPEHDADKIKQEQSELAYNRNNYADYEDAFNRIGSLSGAGELPGGNAFKKLLGAVPMVGGSLAHLVDPGQEAYERARDIEIHELASRMKGGTSEEREATLKAILPSWTDRGNMNQLKRVHEKGVQFFKGQPAEKAATTIKQYGLGIPFPEGKWQDKPQKEKKK